MKYLFAILLFFIVSLETNAQQHDLPFPDSNAVWMMKTYIPQNPFDPLGWSTTCYSQCFTHDTSHVNGYIYQNVYFDFYPSGFDFMYEEISNYLQIGRYRVEDQKVYYQNLFPTAFSIYYDCYIGYNGGNDDFEEFVMYDFGLSVGDTFHLTPYSSIILESIDSVIIEGEYYRRFNFPNVFNTSYYWIEGMGSSIGLFPYFDFFEKQLYFNCFHEDMYAFNFYPNGVGCTNFQSGIDAPIGEMDKKLIKIVDIMGRVVNDAPNIPLIYFYSDGTTEKIFRVE